jgi:biopolymer transport protein ExbB
MIALVPQTPAPQVPSSFTQTIGDFITTGGPLMWPILGCSVIVVGLALERYLVLRSGRVVPRAVRAAVEQICQGNAGAVAEQIAEAPAPAARVLAAGLRRRGYSLAEVEKAMEDQAGKESARLRGNVRAIALMATIGPLLGLLGTVFGIASAFAAAEQKGLGKGDSTENLAAAIGVALHTTILGLIVSVLATLIAAHLQAKIRRLILAIDDTVQPAIDHLAGRPQQPTLPSTSAEATHAA